jgi:hypothetical protein
MRGLDPLIRLRLSWPISSSSRNATRSVFGSIGRFVRGEIISLAIAHRFPLIVATLARLRSRSCIIDGEAVACDDKGVASFDLIRHHRANESIFLYAFDLIELNGDDLRRDPLEVRKATLASIVAKAGSGIRFNEHMEGDGRTVFAHTVRAARTKAAVIPALPGACALWAVRARCAGRDCVHPRRQ